ncbi:MAG: thioredoxin family protein [Candidatus Bathyarchaeota archaeon]|jgi:thioredoxin 1|nr:thioredoxin family protein [Candidatus Bathyarchaeota archaeon]
MNKIIETSATSFMTTMKESEEPVIVEFWIRSCVNCQKFKEVYAQLPEIFGDKINFFAINMFQSLENLKLAEELGVENTPTLKIYRKGKIIGEIIGFRSLDQVIGEIKSILDQ